MAVPNDSHKAKTVTELLKSHEKSQVKQHTVYDAAGRAQFVFTADIKANDGDPCLVTEYVYRSPTSTQIYKRQERVYLWKAIWDTGFAFDPSVSYDADGDGNI